MIHIFKGSWYVSKLLMNHDDCFAQDLKLRVKACMQGCLFLSVLLFCVYKVLIQINIWTSWVSNLSPVPHQ